MNSRLTEKYKALCAIIAEKGDVALAFSGGVDSTFLLKAMMTATSGKAIALLAATPLQPENEIEEAIHTAATIGATVQVRKLDPLSWPDFVKNPPNRCYLCKKAIYSEFKLFLKSFPNTTLIDGTNIDDLQEDRPGHRAIRELDVATPLVEAHLGKDEIRSLSKALQLPTWNKPSASCLATRIPTGQSITGKKLAIIACCESYLHSLGATGCRVRHASDDQVNIELISHDFKLLMDQQIRLQIHNFFKSRGFVKVFLDLSERKGNLV